MSTSKRTLLGLVPFAFALAPALFLGCTSSEKGTYSLQGDEGASVCHDEDGDGYGDGCRAGADCDDSDPSVTDACYRCSTPGPGCPCDVDGQHAGCGKVESVVGDQTVCGHGVMACESGTWGACVINNSVTLAPAAPTGTQGFGGSSKCANNPCDPYCNDFANDNPTGINQVDAGVVTTDAGVTLPGNAPPPPPPPCTGGHTGSCAHALCSPGAALSVGCDNVAMQPKLDCVQTVCAANPSCCTAAWTSACVLLASTSCNIHCGNQNGTCLDCYQDGFDHDGDGWSYTQGDCMDCDPGQNPGAYDFPNNGVDEDCSGVADDEQAHCDAALAMASATGLDYAAAMGLCRTTTASATGNQKTWGVISASLAQANGASASASLSRGILARYGTNNLPREGSKMAAFSTGTARAPGDPGWADPNGITPGGYSGSYNQGTSCFYPSGFPKNAAGCPNASGKAYDSSGLVVKVRVPTNVKSLAYDFNFFTSEYPEYVCSSFNDAFVAILQTTGLPANPVKNSGNISFDSLGNPVSVNNGFFTVTGGPKLLNTGLDGLCWAQDPQFGFWYQTICGGSTDWLESTSPVTPGETVTMQFSIWDSGDHLWDSLVLIDNWQWSANAAPIQTFRPMPATGSTYGDGYFTRDYDVTGLCKNGTVPRWGIWSWGGVTPADSSIEFSVRTAATTAGLTNAPDDPLTFSTTPGPAALNGKNAVAKTGSPDTQLGAAVVDNTLKAHGRVRNNPVVRITSHLLPSLDTTVAPTLVSWDLQYDCIPGL
jgi:hypothetical protein